MNKGRIKGSTVNNIGIKTLLVISEAKIVGGQVLATKYISECHKELTDQNLRAEVWFRVRKYHPSSIIRLSTF